MTSSISLYVDSSSTAPLEEVPEGRFSELLNFEKSKECRWIQIAVIVAGIASVLLLASFGWLPASFLIAARISVIGLSIGLVLRLLYQIYVKKEPPSSLDEKELKRFQSIPASYICLLGPLLEEFFFREMIQGSLQMLLRYTITSPVITLLGVAMPATHLIAMIVTGVIFGAAHYSSERENHGQVLYASLSGVLVEGTIYAALGLGPAIFAHVINNTIALTAMEIGLELERRQKKAQVIPIEQAL